MKTTKVMVTMLTVWVATLANAASINASNYTPNAVNKLHVIAQKTSNGYGAGEWELCYSADQIFIYERWIPVTTDHKIMERKGEMYVDCSFERAKKVLTDYNHFISWTRNVKEIKVLKTKSSSNFILYTLFDLPWPFQNRDVVSEYTVVEVNPGRHLQVKIKSNDNMLPVKSGITRMTKYNATWEVKRINDSKCWVCFSASCDNPPVAPRSIQDPIVQKAFYKNLLALKKHLLG